MKYTINDELIYRYCEVMRNMEATRTSNITFYVELNRLREQLHEQMAKENGTTHDDPVFKAYLYGYADALMNNELRLFLQRQGGLAA